MLERNAVAGGRVATEELTLPGFLHDTFSAGTRSSMGSAAYAELGTELEARGLRLRQHRRPDRRRVRRTAGRSSPHATRRWTAEGFGTADAAAFLGELDRFGAMADEIGTLLSSELHAPGAIAPIVKLGRRLGAPRRPRDRGLRRAERPRLARTRPSRAPSPACSTRRGCCTPGSSRPRPAARCSSSRSPAACTWAACPSWRAGPRASSRRSSGSSATMAARCAPAPTSSASTCRDGRATGVVAGGERIEARRAVIASVTPTQLYGRLLDGARRTAAAATDQAARSATAAARCRSTSRCPSRCAGATTASTAPPSSTCRTGPTPSSSPAPRRSPGCCPPRRRSSPASRHRRPDPRAGRAGRPLDPAAGGPIRAGGRRRGRDRRRDGGWTPALAGAYADRVARAASPSTSPNLPGAVLARTILTPADLEARNINLHRGDLYAGSTHLDQALPLAAAARSRLAPHAGRRALAHRREHPPRSRAERRLGPDRRQPPHRRRPGWRGALGRLRR